MNKYQLPFYLSILGIVKIYYEYMKYDSVRMINNLVLLFAVAKVSGIDICQKRCTFYPILIDPFE